MPMITEKNIMACFNWCNGYNTLMIVLMIDCDFQMLIRWLTTLQRFSGIKPSKNKLFQHEISNIITWDVVRLLLTIFQISIYNDYVYWIISPQMKFPKLKFDIKKSFLTCLRHFYCCLKLLRNLYTAYLRSRA